MRTFFAIKPSRTMLEHIQNSVHRLQDAIPSGVKWISPEQVHITLKFLRDFDSNHISPLETAIDSICRESEPIPLSLTHAGIFPSRGKPRVIWMGLEEEPSLRELVASIEAACAELGTTKEKRPFSPHITIGRVKRHIPTQDLNSIRQAVAALPPISASRFTATRLHFIQSRLTRSGPIYADVFTKAL